MTAGNQPLFDHLDGDEPEADLAGCDPEQLADHLLLDSLLREVHAPDAAAARDRVARAMARIPHIHGPRRHRLTLIQTHRSLAVAATLLVCAGVLWFLFGVTSPTAYAALNRALVSAKVAADRFYQVVVERSLPGPARIEASLYVNGGRKFAVEVKDMPAGTLWAGGNEEHVWLVPAFPPFPVFVSDDPRLMNAWLERQDVQLPFLQITTVLENMQRSYDISFPEAPEAKELPEDLVSVVGKRRTDDPLLPAQIRMLARADSGTVQELLLEWDNSGRRPTPRSMKFTLAGEEPRPPDWYDHAAHHDAGRRLHRF
jgi:hypothetical protein